MVTCERLGCTAEAIYRTTWGARRDQVAQTVCEQHATGERTETLDAFRARVLAKFPNNGPTGPRRLRRHTP